MLRSLLFALALPAAAALSCPPASSDAIKCWCSSGNPNCAAGPMQPTPVPEDLGSDTICAAITAVCAGKVPALLKSLTKGGTCVPDETFTLYTGFSPLECKLALTQGIATLAPASYLCTDNLCNSSPVPPGSRPPSALPEAALLQIE